MSIDILSPLLSAPPFGVPASSSSGVTVGWNVFAPNFWLVAVQGTDKVSMNIQMLVLRRYPDWDNIWYFEFGQTPQILAGQTISTASVTLIDGTMTLGSASINGSQVTFEASGGVAGMSATIGCAVTFSGGSVLSWRGILYTSR